MTHRAAPNPKPRLCVFVLVLTMALTVLCGEVSAQPEAPTTPEETTEPKGPPPTIDHVSGSDGHLWIIQTTPPTPGRAAPPEPTEASKKPAEPVIHLLHRGPDDPPESIYRAMRIRAMPTHIAAHGPTLWLLYKDRSVQTIRMTQTAKNGPRTFPTSHSAPLPNHGTIRNWTADASGPIVLIENEPAPETPEAPDSTPTTDDPKSSNDTKTDPPDGGSDVSEPEAEPLGSSVIEDPEPARLPEAYDRFINPEDYYEADAPAAQTVEDRPRLELIRLGLRGWESIAVPSAIKPQRIHSLLAMGDDRFALVGDHSPESAFTIHAYIEGKWTDRTFGRRLATPWRAVAVSGNVFIVMPSRSSSRYLLSPYLVPFGAQIVSEPELSKLRLINVKKNAVRWWMTPGDQTITAVALNGDGSLWWTVYDIGSDAAMAPPIKPLRVTEPPPPLPQPMTIVMVAAMMIGMLFLLGGGKREAGSPVYVPRGTRPAGKVRIYAAMIDLAPAVAISMVTFGIANPIAIVSQWMNHPDEWQSLAPGLLVIGLFVTHTTLTELFTGATLGKLMFGVRVVSMTGLSPNVWQVLARNSFKVIELMPPFLLLVVPFVNRFRQRLGDMVSRTLVVAPQKNAPREDPLDDEPPDDDPDDPTPRDRW